MISRRLLMLASLGTQGSLWPMAAHALPPRVLVFPRDHGAHPDLRTEWWYVTGHARTAVAPDGMGAPRDFGFQVTFFRSRVEGTQGMGSAFAARQLLFAHSAVTDVQGQRLWHDQRIARQGFGVAEASEKDTAIRLRDWSLVHDGKAYRAKVRAGDFTLDLRFDETQALLLQGRAGLSRKGPEEKQASYYYSQPQLRAQGRIDLHGAAQGTKNPAPFNVEGKAWLDHEWSDELLHPQAVGWDWIGMNLFDGSALTAFRLRTREGTTLYDGGSFRAPGREPYIFSPGEVVFSPQRSWKSPLTQTTYPVEWMVRTPADFYTVRPLLDNQELDSRASTGAIYWEGLSELIDSNGRTVGRGYLEMTGYANPLRL